MRSSGGTILELEESVVTRTKSMIACLASPSFHEASCPPAPCAIAALLRSSAGVGSTARLETKTRRLMPEPCRLAFMAASGDSKKKKPRCPLHREKQRGAEERVP